jgi:indole-3-glycerol phosphate synthase
VILDQILSHKQTEIEAIRERFADWAPPAQPPARRDFIGALRAPGVSLIAEFKRRSPSRGDIRADADPIEVARSYEGAGARALSVLTDAHFFGGAMAHLQRARASTGFPVLRKDFIVDRSQVAESASADGPDCLLLIAAALDVDRLRSLRRLAAECGQRTLVEVHKESELDVALESGAEVIGINNRDLKTFDVSLDTTLALRPRIPRDKLVVSESGIRSADDVRRLADAGVDAILVGEALMAASSPEQRIEELLSGA